MARLYAVNNGASGVALVGAAAKTVLLLLSSAQEAPLLTELGIGFDGVTASAIPVTVDLGFGDGTTAGTGTAGTNTLLRGKGTANATSTINHTAEPTTLTVAKHWYITPNGGQFVLQSPLGREMQGELNTASSRETIFLRPTAPAAVNTRAYFEFEE